MGTSTSRSVRISAVVSGPALCATARAHFLRRGPSTAATHGVRASMPNAASSRRRPAKASPDSAAATAGRRSTMSQKKLRKAQVSSASVVANGPYSVRQTASSAAAWMAAMAATRSAGVPR